MSNDSEFHSGAPNLDEWQGLWRAQSSEEPLTKQEFYAAYGSLRAWLSKLGEVGFDKGCDFYVRGDLYEDRTQDIEIVNPQKLTLSLLDQVQKWIHGEYPSWRVMIPTYIDPLAVVVIYNSVIRLPSQLEPNQEEGLRILRQAMLRNIQEKTTNRSL